MPCDIDHIVALWLYLGHTRACDIAPCLYPSSGSGFVEQHSSRGHPKWLSRCDPDLMLTLQTPENHMITGNYGNFQFADTAIRRFVCEQV